MGYEIIAVDPETGAIVATLTTKVRHAAAHMLMGALGVYYENDDEEGAGDSFKFTDAELSAAEEALVLLDGSLPTEEIRAGITEAQRFLADTRMWMANAEEEVLSVEIGFF